MPVDLGISIIEDSGDGVTMEIEMNWDGNPSIILAIKTRLGVALPVQVTIHIYYSVLHFLLILFASFTNVLVAGINCACYLSCCLPLIQMMRQIYFCR